MNRFKPIYIDRIKLGIQNPITNFEIIKETPTTAVIDGHDGIGHVIGKVHANGDRQGEKYEAGMVA